MKGFSVDGISRDSDMALRTLICVATLAAIGLPGLTASGVALGAGEVKGPESAGSGVRARFLVRISAMLDESGRLERAGKPLEALQIADRASRMLDVIGGEAAWRKTGPSPAAVVARISAQQQSASAVPVRRTENVKPGVRQLVQSQPFGSSAGTRPRVAPVFPDDPVRTQTWVPVGRPVPAAEGWLPFSDESEGSPSGAAVVETLPVESVVSIEGRTLPATATAGAAAGVEQPVPGAEDFLLHTDAEQQAPGLSAELRAEAARSSRQVRISQTAGRSRPEQPVAAEDEPWGTLPASLAGAVCGVCLLAGYHLTRRYVLPVDRSAGKRVTTENSQEVSGQTGDQARGVNRAGQGTADSLPAACADWTPGMLSSDIAGDARQKSETPDSDRDAPLAPVVPLRVFGTDVVLGEAAVAEVDAVLERRRRSVLQAVFDQNIALQKAACDDQIAKAA